MRRQKEIKPAILAIGAGIIFLILIWLIPLWHLSMQFDIRDYGYSAYSLRGSLLEAVPTGSSVEEVYEFMERENIPNFEETHNTCSYRELSDGYVLLLGCTANLFKFLAWEIYFIFDETNHLVDIRVGNGYP